MAGRMAGRGRARGGYPGEARGECGGPAQTNALPARVGDVIYQGDTFLVQAILDDGTRVSARAIAGAAALERAPARNEAVELHFDAGEAVLLPEEGPR